MNNDLVFGFWLKPSYGFAPNNFGLSTTVDRSGLAAFAHRGPGADVRETPEVSVGGFMPQ
jgi:hypothetical protein